jgi:protein TonB
MASPAKLEMTRLETLPADFDGWDAADPPPTLPEDFAGFDTVPAGSAPNPPAEKPTPPALPDRPPDSSGEQPLESAAAPPLKQSMGPSPLPAQPAGTADPTAPGKTGSKVKVLALVAALIVGLVAAILFLHFRSASSVVVPGASPARDPLRQPGPQPSVQPSSQPSLSAGLAKPSPGVPASPSAPSPETPDRDVQPASMDPQLNAPARIAKALQPAPDPGDPTLSSSALASIGGVAADSVKGVFGAKKGPAVKPESKPIQISAGVAEGHLVRKFLPEYPQIARSARVAGTVVVNAVISKTGIPQDVHAMSGPEMLRLAAESAVRNWRYKPYLLNNQPVDVETRIDIVFSMNR